MNTMLNDMTVNVAKTKIVFRNGGKFHTNEH